MSRSRSRSRSRRRRRRHQSPSPRYRRRSRSFGSDSTRTHRSSRHESKDALSKLQDLILAEEIVQKPTDDYFDLLCEDWSDHFNRTLFMDVLDRLTIVDRE